MSLFDWLLRRGRTTTLALPARQTAGRWMPAAAVQRAHIDLADVLPDVGVVQRIDGTYTAIAEVLYSFPQHARGNDETMRYLREVCRALNSLPDNEHVVMIARAKTGGLEAYAVETRQQHQRLLPANPLRALLANQAHHAIARMQQGKVRQTYNYLAATGDSPNQARQRLDDAMAILAPAKIATRVLTDARLLRAITESWQPRSVQHFVEDFFSPDGDVVCSLIYSPGAARVSQPRYVAQELTNHAPSLAAPARVSLPRPKPARATTTRALAKNPSGTLPSRPVAGRKRLAAPQT